MTVLGKPMPFNPTDDPRTFRNALSRFATGITVVTIMTEQGPVGITANSFTSVSLAPPLVLWSPAKTSRRHDVFVNATHFAVHVLAADQRAVCDGFTTSWNAFEALDVVTSPEDVPIIQGCLAVFECRTHNIIDAGDHTLILGEVHAAAEREGDALVFSSGKYASLPIDG